ncbi:hypothetical protein M422DRAFT_33754 [Sphaerobolus stellatus SS14]|uniref:Uncharacterized protein n=1 Tax=Sphaerobolus stellatus (strain SS14) TaxID=990650 RepID=A0A0C9VIR1_SPHS4|nr:hypothetical protein M422DRAFT_33754 [Sphaerobolus stellatus SS14]
MYVRRLAWHGVYVVVCVRCWPSSTSDDLSIRRRRVVYFRVACGGDHRGARNTSICLRVAVQPIPLIQLQKK